MNEGYVKSSSRANITTVEFFHPQSNSLPARILDDLAKEIHSAGNDDETKVIIIKSAGDRTFCAGASFDELVAIKNQQEGLDFFSGFAHIINAMRKCPQFIITRVQGKCVGGGVGIVAASDYAIAMESAEIRLSELAIGIGPFVVGPAVERKIGLSAFSQLAIDANLWRNADWARRRGLYAEMHSSIEAMDESIDRLARNLSHYSPQAMAELKKTFWKGTDDWDKLLIERAAISGRLILSDHSKKAIQGFKAKRTN
ncbi:MAG TPA: enoyl-CoA hydratase/isomerase family protein [Puia sp.]|nr:enoyl-CoA hydratase/isomerase family protein [Puia sp.]